MKRFALRLACLAGLAGLPSLAAADDIKPLPSFAEPAISPDGKEIAFVHAGDIWIVPSQGGTAHLLVSDPANETRPLYSPDGKQLAFVSNRTGNGDIYLLTFDTGDITRLTSDDGLDQLDGWSADGKWIYFSSTVADLGASNADIYRVRTTGGTPMPISEERYTNEFHAAPAPKGQALAMSAGASSRDWWRNGHANWNEAHVYIRRDRGKRGPNYEELTQPGARELWPMWSADGKTLFCVSDRDGGPQNIVAYDVSGPMKAGEPRPVKSMTSFKDGRVLWPTISADGKTIVFERDFGIWRMPATGGTPWELKITLRGAASVPVEDSKTYTGGFRDLAVSPDGKKLAFSVHGEIFAVSAAGGGRATRVTNTHASEGQIDWSPDSQQIVYVSDRGGNGNVGGVQNLYLYDFGKQIEIPLTTGKTIDSTPRFAPGGGVIVYRRNGSELRLMEIGSKQERSLVGGLASVLPPFDNLAAPYVFSPKGKWLAYIDSGRRGYDNVYVIPTNDRNAKPTQVTFFANTGSNSVSWSGDGRSLMFGTGMRTEDYQLARIDLLPRPANFSEDQFRGLFKDEMKTQRPGTPQPAPPPQRQPEKPSEKQPSTDDRPSPPNTVPTTPETEPATKPVKPTQVKPDDNKKPADKMPDEKKPADKKPDEKKPDEKKPDEKKPGEDKPEKLITPEPATKPAVRLPGVPTIDPRLFPSLERFDLTDIRQRTSLLQVGLDVDFQTVSSDGKWCAFIGTTGGRQNVYVYPLVGSNNSIRQLTSTTGGKGWLRFAPDSREIYYVENGRIYAVAIDSRNVREVAIQAPMEVDFNQEKLQVASQAWRYLGMNFYDPKMHGVDWAATWKTFAPRFAGAKTDDELRRLMALMVGELNASHTGVSGGRSSGTSVGRLAVKFDRAAYEKSGLLTISEVLPGGPAEQAGIKAGEQILGVDGEPVGAGVNLYKLLDRKIGRKVELLIKAAGKDDERTVALQPVDVGTEKTLLYRAWMERNRQQVAKASNGRLGYVHIADMGSSALTRLNADLDAEAATSEGVVVDIRANTGGFVSPYVLDVLSRRSYLSIARRGATESPGRIYVGQRSLDLPTVLVTNRQSISDAENFTEGYRALKLGKVVGEPTAGGVIFTSDVTLMDGTSVRIPFSKVTDRAGESLEGAGRPVDIEARRQLGESQAGKDSQLDAAVKTLLRQVDRAKVAREKEAARKQAAAKAEDK